MGKKLLLVDVPEDEIDKCDDYTILISINQFIKAFGIDNITILPLEKSSSVDLSTGEYDTISIIGHGEPGKLGSGMSTEEVKLAFQSIFKTAQGVSSILVDIPICHGAEPVIGIGSVMEAIHTGITQTGISGIHIQAVQSIGVSNSDNPLISRAVVPGLEDVFDNLVPDTKKIIITITEKITEYGQTIVGETSFMAEIIESECLEYLRSVKSECLDIPKIIENVTAVFERIRTSTTRITISDYARIIPNCIAQTVNMQQVGEVVDACLLLPEDKGRFFCTSGEHFPVITLETEKSCYDLKRTATLLNYIITSKQFENPNVLLNLGKYFIKQCQATIGEIPLVLKDANLACPRTYVKHVHKYIDDIKSDNPIGLAIYSDLLEQYNQYFNAAIALPMPELKKEVLAVGEEIFRHMTEKIHALIDIARNPGYSHYQELYKLTQQLLNLQESIHSVSSITLDKEMQGINEHYIDLIRSSLTLEKNRKEKWKNYSALLRVAQMLLASHKQIAEPLQQQMFMTNLAYCKECIFPEIIDKKIFNPTSIDIIIQQLSPPDKTAHFNPEELIKIQNYFIMCIAHCQSKGAKTEMLNHLFNGLLQANIRKESDDIAFMKTNYSSHKNLLAITELKTKNIDSFKRMFDSIHKLLELKSKNPEISTDTQSVEKLWSECIAWYKNINVSLLKKNPIEYLDDLKVQQTISKYLEGASYKILSLSQQIEKNVQLKNLREPSGCSIFAYRMLGESSEANALKATICTEEAYGLTPSILPEKSTLAPRT